MQISTRPGSSAEETRSRILAAARAIYEQNGTRGTTTREVADRAGVNEATLFRHFGSKRALLEAMRESACSLDVLENELASLTGNLEADLGKIAGLLVGQMHDRRMMLCISLAEDASGTSEPEWRGPLGLMDRVERYFQDQIAAGRMRGEAHRLAAYFMGMCFSYVIGRRVWNSYVVKPRDIDYLVDVFLNGVR